MASPESFGSFFSHALKFFRENDIDSTESLNLIGGLLIYICKASNLPDEAFVVIANAMVDLFFTTKIIEKDGRNVVVFDQGVEV